MTLTGPEALRSLEDALRDVRREEDELAKRLARSAELVSKIRAQESEFLRQLAKVRLDPTTQGELSGRLSAAERAAREMLKKHQDRIAVAEAALSAHDAEIGRLGTERGEVTAAAEKHDAELKRLAEKVAGEASKSPEYAEKRKIADALRHVAEESLQKTLQAEGDREEKGRPYRDDPLFMYLWERSYGTRNYRANNLVMYLDGLVAGLVRYRDARPNFAMLNEIPLRLREHAERQREKAEEAMAEVVALEEAAVDAAGGKPVREALIKARERIAEIDAALVTIEDERDEAAKELRELAQGSDPAFAGAIGQLAESLGRADIQTLLAEARATRTPEDDAIVKQIDDARTRAQEEENETQDQKSRLKTLAARRRELEDIQYEFKKQGFDRPQSSFREDNLVGDVLTDFLRGGISAASYWEQWRKSQNWTGGSDPWRHYDLDDRDDDDNRRRRNYERRDRDDDDDDDRRLGGPSGPWGGGVQWPDTSFGGSTGSSRRGSGTNWGRLPGMGGGMGGGFSRPRGGGGFRTGGGMKSGGGFRTGGGF
jgi:hypothetical protein